MYMKSRRKKGTSKYFSKKRIIDWIKFDSKQEAVYYEFLKKQLESGEIKSFECHPTYELLPKFRDNQGRAHRTMTYIADFIIKHNDWTIEVIDIKWMATEVAKIKKKLFLHRYPHIKLTRLVYVVKRWWRLSWEDNHRMKREEKKAKNASTH